MAFKSIACSTIKPRFASPRISFSSTSLIGRNSKSIITPKHVIHETPVLGLTTLNLHIQKRLWSTHNGDARNKKELHTSQDILTKTLESNLQSTITQQAQETLSDVLAEPPLMSQKHLPKTDPKDLNETKQVVKIEVPNTFEPGIPHVGNFLLHEKNILQVSLIIPTRVLINQKQFEEFMKPTLPKSFHYAKKNAYIVYDHEKDLRAALEHVKNNHIDIPAKKPEDKPTKLKLPGYIIEETLKPIYEISMAQLDKLPKKTFPGKYLVVRKPEEIDNALEMLLGTKDLDNLEKPIYVGMDVEYTTKEAISLLQLSTNKHAVLFRFNLLKHHWKQIPIEDPEKQKSNLARNFKFKYVVPSELAKLLSHPKIFKVGLGLDTDIGRMKYQYEVEVTPTLEISTMHTAKRSKPRSLLGLTGIFLGYRFSKKEQQSDWDSEILNERQLDYAAMDAWVSRKLYLRMIELEEKLVNVGKPENVHLLEPDTFRAVEQKRAAAKPTRIRLRNSKSRSRVLLESPAAKNFLQSIKGTPEAKVIKKQTQKKEQSDVPSNQSNSKPPHKKTGNQYKPSTSQSETKHTRPAKNVQRRPSE